MNDAPANEPPWKVPRWIWKNPRIKPGAMRDVLVVLLWHQGDNATAWPTVATVATESGYSDRAVRAAIVELEKLGFLMVDRGGRSRGLSSRYVVVEHPLPDPRPESESREKPRQILPVVESESREKPRQILPDPPAKFAGPHRQILPDPPAKFAGQEPDHRTKSVEPSQGTATRARAPARAPLVEPGADPPGELTGARLRALLERAVGRATGTAPWLDHRRVQADELVRRLGLGLEAEVEHFERWLAGLDVERRPRDPWLRFCDGVGRWAELAAAPPRRRGPVQPGSVEEFEREAVRLEAEGWA